MILSAAGIATVATAQTSFGVQANGILASQSASESDVQLKSMFSWKAGVVANIPLAQNISLMPQLNFVVKGSKFNYSGSEDFGGFSYSVTAKGNQKLNYLELPVYFLYNTGSNEGFFGGIGPVFSLGLSGKASGSRTMSFNGNTQTDDLSSNIKFDGKKDAQDNDGHYKAFEFGGSVLAGYRLSNGLFFNLHYTAGLSNLTTDKENDGTLKNNYFGFGVGYFFKSK